MKESRLILRIYLRLIFDLFDHLEKKQTFEHDLICNYFLDRSIPWRKINMHSIMFYKQNSKKRKKIFFRKCRRKEYSLDFSSNLMRKQFIPGIIVIPSGKSNLSKSLFFLTIRGDLELFVAVWNGVHLVSHGPYEGAVFRFLIFIPENFPDGDCPVCFLFYMIKRSKILF